MCDFAYNLGNPQKLLYVTPYDEKEQIHLDAKEYKFGNGSYGPSDFDIEEVKPYLRPMSSMTEKENSELGELVTIYDMVDYMLAHHFDVHNLIEKGLALEAPEVLYKAE